VPADPEPAPATGPATASVPERSGLIRSRIGGLPRSFWVLWVGTVINRTATFVEPFLVLYLTQSRHVSVATAGAVLGVAGFGSIVSQPLGGFLADHAGRRWTLAAGMAGTAAAELALGYSPSLAVTFVVAGVFGVLVDLYRPAVQAILSDLMPPRERPRAFGLLFWAINLGFSFAMVGGGLLAQHGFIWLFWADAATCLGFGALVLRAVPETRPVREPGQANPSISVALRDRLMLAIVGLSLIYASIYTQATAGLPLAMSRAGFSAAAYGVTVAVNGIVIVIVQPVVVAWLARHDHARFIATGQLLVGLGFGATAFAANLPAYMATVVVWTLGEICTASLLSSVIADLAPRLLRGRYQGLIGLAWGGGGLIGPLVGAAVLQTAGPHWLWGGCAVFGALSAVGFLTLGPAIRRRQAAVLASA
jgi:MFS family permease